MRIFAYIVIAFAFILPSASFSQTNSPSYNCSLVTQDVEVFVCNDSFLASMDRDLSKIYRSYIASLPYDQAELLRKGEAAWVRDRNNRCKIGERLVDRSCIEAAYRGRITALNSLASLSFVPGEWAFEGMKWVQLASRSSADEAKAIAASLRNKVPQHGPYLVLLTLNGWYAVASGPFDASRVGSILEDIKALDPSIAAEEPIPTKGLRYAVRLYHSNEEIPDYIPKPSTLQDSSAYKAYPAPYTAPSSSNSSCSSREIQKRQAVCFVALAGEMACQSMLEQHSEAGVVLTGVTTSALCSAASSGLQNGTIDADAVLGSAFRGGIAGIGSAMMHEDNDAMTRLFGAFLKYGVVTYEISQAIDCARAVERQCGS